MNTIVKATQTLLDYVGQRLTPNRTKWLSAFIGWRLLLWGLMVTAQATVLSAGIWTQYLYFLSTARLSDQGYYPLLNQWIEYPPIFPWLNVLLYRVSRWALDCPASVILFYALLGLVFTLSEIGILILVYRIMRHLANETLATVAAFIFSLTSWPTYLFYGWYDPIAAFLFVLALERLLVRRIVASAVCAAVGFLVKLFPLLLVAVVFRVIQGFRQKALYALVAGGVIAGVLLPFAWASPEMMEATLRWLPNKSTYQTIYALIDGYYSFGVAPSASDFTEPGYAGWVHHPSRVPAGLVTVVFGLLGLFVYSHPRPANENLAILVLTGLITQLMMLYLKGYSPQFLIWFLPIIVMILPDARGLLYGLSLAILNVMEYPLYFVFWHEIHGILAVIILARTAIWALLAVEYWGIYRSWVVTPLSAR